MVIDFSSVPLCQICITIQKFLGILHYEIKIFAKKIENNLCQHKLFGNKKQQPF